VPHAFCTPPPHPARRSVRCGDQLEGFLQLQILELGDLRGGHCPKVVGDRREDRVRPRDRDVRRDPGVPDDAAFRGQPLDRPDPERGAVRQRKLAENRPGPERRDADDLRTMTAAQVAQLKDLQLKKALELVAAAN
jgi:hypothetical protein